MKQPELFPDDQNIEKEIEEIEHAFWKFTGGVVGKESKEISKKESNDKK